MQISAKYYSAGSNQTQLISLTLVGQRLIGERLATDCLDADCLDDNAIKTNSNLFNIELSAIHVSDELGSLPTELSFKDGSKVEYAAQDEFDSTLRKHIKGRSKLLHFFEKNKKAWLVCAVLVPLSLIVLIKVVIPSSVGKLVALIPPAMVQNIDEQVLSVIDDELITESKISAKVQKDIQGKWQDLLTRLPLNDYHYQLLFRGGKRYGANAFALPGGTIVVTDELVELFETNTDALMAILLHEIGHIENQHSMKTMTETLGTSLLFTYFLGDMQGMAEFANASVVTLIKNDYSRELESEADDYALMQLQLLDIPIQGFVDAMEGLEKEHGKQIKAMKYFSTHPELTERIEKGKVKSLQTDKTVKQ